MGAKDLPINLRIPGPTPLPPQVLKAISKQQINHRGHHYEEMHSRVVDNLKYFFQTTNDIFLLTSSGMGGLEAAIVNFFSPGDTLVFFTVGDFGNRWAEIGKRFAANVVQIKFKPGSAVDSDEVYKTLAYFNDVQGVFFTHNETATGVINDLARLAPLVKDHIAKPLLLIDSISALGAVDLPMDNLGIDVLVSASQKAWMAPAGISMIAVSDNAWKKHKTASMPRYYFDLEMYAEFAKKNQTPATCAVTTIFGLDQALTLMKTEGKENIYTRHKKIRQKMRDGTRKIGLQLFVKEADASPTVTSIQIPDGIDSKTWLTLLREKYHVELAGGMGETKGKIIRVAHMGYVNEENIDEVLKALEESLKELKK